MLCIHHTSNNRLTWITFWRFSHLHNAPRELFPLSSLILISVFDCNSADDCLTLKCTLIGLALPRLTRWLLSVQKRREWSLIVLQFKRKNFSITARTWRENELKKLKDFRKLNVKYFSFFLFFSGSEGESAHDSSPDCEHNFLFSSLAAFSVLLLRKFSRDEKRRKKSFRMREKRREKTSRNFFHSWVKDKNLNALAHTCKINTRQLASEESKERKQFSLKWFVDFYDVFNSVDILMNFQALPPQHRSPQSFFKHSQRHNPKHRGSQICAINSTKHKRFTSRAL